MMGIAPWRLYGNVPAAVGCVVGSDSPSLAWGSTAILARLLAPKFSPRIRHTVTASTRRSPTRRCSCISRRGRRVGRGRAPGGGCATGVSWPGSCRPDAGLRRPIAGARARRGVGLRAPDWAPVAMAVGLRPRSRRPRPRGRALNRRRLTGQRTLRGWEAAAGKAGTMLLVPLAAMFPAGLRVDDDAPLVVAWPPARLAG